MTLGWLAGLVLATPAFSATVDYFFLDQPNIPSTFRNGTVYLNLETATGPDVARARIGAYNANSGGALITRPAYWAAHGYAPDHSAVKRIGLNGRLPLLSGDFFPPVGWRSGFGRVDGFGDFGDALSTPVRSGGGVNAFSPLLFAIDTGSAPGYFYPSAAHAGEGNPAYVAHVLGISNPGTCPDLSALHCHAVVPLPASVWLLLSGFVALGALARRRGQT